MAKKELNEVLLLRGVASLMVCLFHLILGNEALFPSTHPLERIFSYGYLGVEVFFILSGYVICYSLPAGFNYSYLRSFFLKRLARIEPPYLVSIVLVLLLNYISSAVSGITYQTNFLALIGHLAYINNFYPATYVNVVYWTLGIEAQFYFLIALVFPLLQVSRPFLVFTAASLLLLACIAIPSNISVILPYLAYFTLGILLFFFKAKRQLPFAIFIFFVFLSCLQIQIFQGTPGTVAAVLSVVILLFWKHVNKTIRFFSTISYSLYLIHVPVGGKVINLGMRFVSTELSKYLLLFLALLVSIGFAYLFYRFVELPSFRLSKRIKYPSNRSPIPVVLPHEPITETGDKPTASLPSVFH
ncbi:MAG: acyltransferase [Chitinophagaceae bacterium]|nr:MAG: acyltransferase [Chitinophagaceae bacterium]